MRCAPSDTAFASRAPQVERARAGWPDFWPVRAVLAAGLFLAHGACVAQIYAAAATATDSSIVLSNFSSAETPVLLVAAPAGLAEEITVQMPTSKVGDAALPRAMRLPAAPVELQRMIAEVAAQVQIAPELLHAVIAAESSYNSHARSAKGAIGLMQLMPTTATRFGARDPYVARQNVLAGASYLKWLMALFQNDIELVLAAYNAGEQAVLKAGGRIPPYPETMAYVPRVLAYLRCARSVACKAA